MSNQQNQMAGMRIPVRNGMRYTLSLKRCTKCNGAVLIHERISKGAVVETEGYCQNCGAGFYGPKMQPAALLT